MRSATRNSHVPLTWACREKDCAGTERLVGGISPRKALAGGGLRGVTSENSDSRAHEDSEQVQEPTAVRSAVPAGLRLVLAAAGTRMRLLVEPIPSPASRGAAERGLA